MSPLFSFQPIPQHVVSRRQYSPTSLTKAYLAVKEDNLSVYKASKVYRVPEQTLRDRVIGRINIDTVTTGRIPVLSLPEEEKLASHLQVMAKYGYGYIRQEVCDIATDYAIQLGKRTKENPFTLNWFNKFIKRWPQLRVLKPRGLEKVRAKSASASVVCEYFQELEITLDKYNLRDKPHLIYNIDEKGVMQNHTPPSVVAGTDFHPPSVVSQKGQTTTIIGCGSASGVAVPPFFVFAGKRFVTDLMKNSSPGADGMMSDSGWVNTDVFRYYMQHHLTKFLPQRDSEQHLLIILDGHKSHISLDLVEWAKQQNIILFILPAHCSHILQPLDVGCYGPFQRMYNSTCHKFMRETSASITRYNICELSCKVYSKALSADNLHSAFMRTGIYPLDSTAINKESLIPAEVFRIASESDKQGLNIQNNELHSDSSQADVSSDVVDLNTTVDKQLNENDAVYDADIFDSKLKQLLDTKRQKDENIKKRRNVSEVVAGKPITESPIQSNLASYREQSTSTLKKQNVKRKHASSVLNKGKTLKSSKKSKSSTEKGQKKINKSRIVQASPKPGTSYVYIDNESSQSEEEENMPESEKCCVCKRYQPKELVQCVSLVFTKWAQCTLCSHWVHLVYCSDKRCVRSGDPFYCIHCSPGSEE